MRASVQEFLPAALDFGSGLTRQEFVHPASQEPVARNPQDLDGSRVHLDKTAIVVRDRDRVESVLEQSPQARFALHQVSLHRSGICRFSPEVLRQPADRPGDHRERKRARDDRHCGYVDRPVYVRRQHIEADRDQRSGDAVPQPTLHRDQRHRQRERKGPQLGRVGGRQEREFGRRRGPRPRP